jgi:ferric-dicitrate binding protein FerR (iron transport regulator)
VNDDDLWDGSGTPDPEIRRLERLLGQLRHRGAVPEAAQQAPGSEAPAPQRRSSPARLASRRRWPLALAAGLALAAAAFWLWPRRSQEPPALGWEVARLAGAPSVGPGAAGPTGRLGVGQWLETDEASRARLQVPGIGFVEVEPRTRIGLLRTGSSEHRLALERGEVHALISAPPRLFFVETPSATAVDLGCAYDLIVDDAGRGRLHVRAGYVALESRGRESLVPAGAVCETRPGIGPGTPYSEQASEALRSALRRLDFESAGSEALEIVLAEAQERDTLTLWHLLARVDGVQRGRVYDRMAGLAPPPDKVTRSGILQLDEQMLALWKEDLYAHW